MHYAYRLHLHIGRDNDAKDMKNNDLHKSIVFNIFAPLFLPRYSRQITFIMKHLVLLLLLGTSVQIFGQGQGGVNSPFSRFGIGDILTENPIHIRQMGGIGTSYLDLAKLNFENPASLGYLNQTAFDVGIDFRRARLSDETSETTQWSGNLSYLALGFTLRNPTNSLFSREDYKVNWSMGFAIIPNSVASYDITRIDSTANGELFERNFQGSGGTFKAIWGNAVKIGNFSVGANIGWIFGNIDFQRNIDFLSEIAAFDNDFSSSYSLRGFYGKLGVNYLHILNRAEMLDAPGTVPPISLSFGLTYKPELGFNTNANVLNVNSLPFSLTAVVADTLEFSPNIEGNGTLPAELGLGVTFTKGIDYGIGIDFKRTFWSSYRNDANPEQLANTTRIGLGGHYRPVKTITAPFYRIGFYYEQNPQIIEGNQLEGYGVTVGIGQPLAWQRRFSHVNLGFDIGKRSVSNILRENFVKITFGFTFNESDWFRRYYLD